MTSHKKKSNKPPVSRTVLTVSSIIFGLCIVGGMMYYEESQDTPEQDQQQEQQDQAHYKIYESNDGTKYQCIVTKDGIDCDFDHPINKQ